MHNKFFTGVRSVSLTFFFFIIIIIILCACLEDKKKKKKTVACFVVLNTGAQRCSGFTASHVACLTSRTAAPALFSLSPCQCEGCYGCGAASSLFLLSSISWKPPFATAANTRTPKLKCFVFTYLTTGTKDVFPQIHVEVFDCAKTWRFFFPPPYYHQNTGGGLIEFRLFKSQVKCRQSTHSWLDGAVGLIRPHSSQSRPKLDSIQRPVWVKSG